MNAKRILSIFMIILSLFCTTACRSDSNSNINSTDVKENDVSTEKETVQSETTNLPDTELLLDKEYSFVGITFNVPNSWEVIDQDSMIGFTTGDSSDGAFAIQAVEWESHQNEAIEITTEQYQDHYDVSDAFDFNSVVGKAKMIVYSTEHSKSTLTYLFFHNNYIYHFTFNEINAYGNETTFSKICPEIFNTIKFND